MEIAITGASGFIGREAVKFLTSVGHKVFAFDKTDRQMLPKQLMDGTINPFAVVHLGAHTDTLCEDKIVFDDLNLNYSKQLWKACVERKKKLIYASSAATYGDGNQGFEDLTEKLPLLKPLNPYGQSKHDFDLWAIEQAKSLQAPPNWAGLKFFNVYGPDEASKGRMASMVWQIFQQAKQGKVRLFKHGEQKRDWVSVYDVVAIIEHLLSYDCYSIYNVGSGKARSFNEIAKLAFEILGEKENIEYFDMPESMKSAYQNFSQADLSKLRRTGYESPMTSLETGMSFMS